MATLHSDESSVERSGAAQVRECRGRLEGGREAEGRELCEVTQGGRVQELRVASWAWVTQQAAGNESSSCGGS